MNIYVGNLSAETTADELRLKFMAFGEVTSVTIMSGRNIGDFRGHGFVEMPTFSEGESAIAALNRSTLRYRRINVIQALPLSHKAGSSIYDGSYGDKPLHRSNSRAKRETSWTAGQPLDS